MGKEKFDTGQINTPLRGACSLYIARQIPCLTMLSCGENGVEVFIAATDYYTRTRGSASRTLLPVLGVPMPSSTFVNGLDALLSIVQMPAGIPVGTLAVGKAGAINAALLAASILGSKYPEYREAVRLQREKQAQIVLENAQVKG